MFLRSTAAILAVTGLALAGCGQGLAQGPTHAAAPGQAPLVVTLTQGPRSTPEPINTATPACTQAGATETGEIATPDEGIHYTYTAYLPPCYAQESDKRYPVLYWTAISDPSILETTETLIRRGAIPAHIVILLDLDLTAGMGSDARLIHYVVPYVDGRYRTRAERRERSITGISHGAAIAARAAFQAPDVFGRVAVISGGIVASEQEKFARWIQATPREIWPQVLIDVGDQDAIFSLTQSLIQVLDQQGVPYTLTQGHGGHSFTYWNGRMEGYLQWLMGE